MSQADFNDAALASLTAQMYSVQARVIAAQAELASMQANDNRKQFGQYTEEAYMTVQKKIEGYAVELSAIASQMWDRGQMMS